MIAFICHIYTLFSRNVAATLVASNTKNRLDDLLQAAEEVLFEKLNNRHAA